MQKGVLCCKKTVSTNSVESGLLSKIPVWIIAIKYGMVLVYVKRVFHRKVHFFVIVLSTFLIVMK